MKRTTTADHPLLPVWQEQLAVLNQNILVGSEDPWLDQVRAKVLRYLISRYGKQIGDHQGETSNPLIPHSVADDRPTFYVNPNPLGFTGISGNRIRELVWNIREYVHPNAKRN